MTLLNVNLAQNEELVAEPTEIAYRQVAPHMLIDEEKVASTAFGPLPADQGMPSFSRSSVVTAQESRDWFSVNSGKISHAVYGVTVEEVIAAGTVVVDDSACELAADEIRSPGHCFVNYRELSRPERKTVRAKLYMSAMDRKEIPTRPLQWQEEETLLDLIEET